MTAGPHRSTWPFFGRAAKAWMDLALEAMLRGTSEPPRRKSRIVNARAVGEPSGAEFDLRPAVLS